MRVHLRTFGCRANQYDSERVRAMLVAAGHELVAEPAEADVAVLNSCAVTAEAERELRRAVRRAARENAALRTVVMGCAAARDAESGAGAIAALPSVRAVVPGADLAGVARALDLPPGAASIAASAQTGARALLRVQDGCDEHCTFCATTLARGASRSRAPDALAAEAARLAETHPEIVLTGVHVGSYGGDIGTSLGALVERLVRAVPRVRFRLASVEATELCERLVSLMADAPDRLAPHLHAPLQSGSDRVLRRMGRHWYTAGAYAAAVERLAARVPVLGLGADIVCGFPGETEEDHAATVALARALPFTYLHVFPFSLRPGTAAERLPGRVDAPTVARRAAELRAVGEARRAAHRAARRGGRADVVVVRSGARGEGLTEDYLAVVPGDPALQRRARVAARLDDAGPGPLVARPEPW